MEYTINGKLVLDVAAAGRQLDTIKEKTSNIEKENNIKTKKIEDQWASVGKKLTDVGSKMTKSLTLPIAGLIGAAVKFASDLDEELNKTEVVFKDNADTVSSWSTDVIDDFGLSQQSALTMANQFGAMAESMQLPTNTAEMSTTLSELAADMASFHNVSVERAGVALKGIFTGETEALKTFGIVMTETNVKQFAEDNGAVWKELTTSEQTMWRYKYVLEMTRDVQGDFARTSDSVANQSRTAKERLKELAAEFGDNLLGAAQKALGKLNDLLEWFKGLDESKQNAILWGLGIVAAIGPILTIAGKASTAISGLIGLFSKGTLSMATLGWVGVALVAVAAVATIVTAIQDNYNTINADAIALKESMKTMSEDMAAIQDTFDEDKANIEATAALAEDYITTLLKLEYQGVKTKEQQTEYANTVKQLKRVMPDLNIVIDAQTGKIEGGTRALLKNVDAWKQNAIAEALMRKQADEMSAVADAWIALDKAQRKSAENNESIIAKTAQINANFDALATAVGSSEKATYYLNGQFSQWSTGTSLLSTETQALIEQTKTLQGEVDILSQGQSSLNAELVTAEGAYSDAEKQVVDTTKVVEDYGNVNKDTAPKIDGTTAAIDENTAAIEANKAEMERLKEVSLAVSESVINDFELLSLKGEKSLKELTANLTKNKITMQTVWTDISSLTKRGVEEGVLQYLYSMGEEGYAIIHKMSTSSDKEMNAFVDALVASGVLADKDFLDAIDGMPEEVKAVLGLTKDTAATGGEGIGAALGAGIVKGIGSASQNVADAANAIVTNAVRAVKNVNMIQSPSKKTQKEIGEPLAEGIVVGFESKIKNAMSRISTGTSAMLSGIKGENKVGGSSIVQNNTFTSKELTPYEQRVQLMRMDRDLAEAFA